MKTTLLPHQQEAINKILKLKTPALFMEMGTGKSRTLIEYAIHKFKQNKIDKVIWFCPVTTKFNAQLELEKHIESPIYYTFDNKTKVGKIPKVDWYIVGIESISSSIRVFEAVESIVENALVVIDESDLIKCHTAIRSRRLWKLGEKANYKMIMTGTPISNGIEDLFSQFYFLSWRIIGYQKWKMFEYHHLEYTDNLPRRVRNRINEDFINAKIAPYVYQINKSQCVNLPKKNYKVSTFNMTDEQSELYGLAKEEILLSDNAFTLNDMTIYRLFSALQRIASEGHYYSKEQRKLFNIFSNPHDNPRIQTLLYCIEEFKNEKIVIWSKFSKEIEDIKTVLIEKYGEHNIRVINGLVKEKNRFKSIKDFNNGARFLVINQAVGGRGINLTSSNHSIFYSTTFKVALRLQAEDRLHRIGQNKQVSYYDIIAESSIDEKIRRCQNDRIDTIEWFKKQIELIKKTHSEIEAMAKIKELVETI